MGPGHSLCDAGSIFETHGNESKQEEDRDKFVLFAYTDTRALKDNELHLAAVSIIPHLSRVISSVDLSIINRHHKLWKLWKV